MHLAINRIGRINKGEDNLVSMEEVHAYLEQESRIEKIKESNSPLDLLRYQSLRLKTILILAITLCIGIIYYAYSTAEDNYGFNPQLNQFLIGFSELMALPFSTAFAPTLPRKSAGLAFFLCSGLLSVGVWLVEVPSNCEYCPRVFWQMGLVMVSRFTFILGYSLFMLLLNESYPVSVKSIALFMNGIVISGSFVVAQILFTFDRVMGVHPFLLLALFYLMIVVMYIPLAETLEVRMPNYVEEVEGQMRKEDD